MMQAEEATVGLVDITQTVDSIREELKSGEIACETMLTKIDAAIASIDSALDKGIADEKKYLGLRDELVELRLELPCLGNELTKRPLSARPSSARPQLVQLMMRTVFQSAARLVAALLWAVAVDSAVAAQVAVWALAPWL